MMTTVIESEEMTEVFHFKTYKDIEKSNNVDLMIKTVLLKIGIKPINKGFKYLCTAISLKLSDPNMYDGFLTKRLYVDVAKEYNTSPSRIERCIRHSIKSVDYTDPDVCYAYLGNENQICCYTNGDFISSICELIKFNI